MHKVPQVETGFIAYIRLGSDRISLLKPIMVNYILKSNYSYKTVCVSSESICHFQSIDRYEFQDTLMKSC